MTTSAPPRLISSPADIPDQTGRTVLITGANSGIGREAARMLAAAGAHVVLAVRDPEKGRSAAAGIPGSTEVRELDLANLESVRALAAGWTGPLDLLINNAGVMFPPLGRTADGFETQFGTNHLGHFALTGLLLGHVRGRVVTISSVGHRWGSLDFTDLNWERRRYRRMQTYGQSKLANLLFTLELSRRLVAADSPVLATAAHPGFAATNLQFHTGSALATPFMRVGNLLFAQSAEAGALPTIAAALGDVPSGAYVGPGGLGESRGAPALVSRSRTALDTGTAERLWTASEELTGVRYPLSVGS